MSDLSVDALMEIIERDYGPEARADMEPFFREQEAWIEGWYAGWTDARGGPPPTRDVLIKGFREWYDSERRPVA